VWNLRGLAPKPSNLIIAAVLSAVAGSAACGPSSNPATFNIVFTLSESPSDLATLEFRVVYDHGSFAGNGTSVNCSLASDDGDTIAASDNDTGTLTISIDASDNALVSGDDIVKCNFLAEAQPTSNDFAVTILAADDGSGHAVANLNDIAVVVTSTDVETAGNTATGSIK
jgi:hypothetical protein